MYRKPIVVENEEALLRLARPKAFLLRMPGSRLVLGFLAGSPDRPAWEARLNRFYEDCGCGIGAFVTLVSLSGYLTTLGVLGKRWEVRPGAKAWIGVLIFACSAALGKAIGLLVSRARFKRELGRFVAVKQSRTFSH